MLDIIIPTIVVTSITLLLAALVLAARRWLTPVESVDIRINHRRTVQATAGQKLLRALDDNGVYLPAACGGRGSCGQCRIRIEHHAGRLLPIEASHISRTEAARGTRLACLLTLRSDLDIVVPDDLLDARRWVCSVESNESVTPFLKQLVLRLPDDAVIEFEAGDYVLIEAPPHDVRFEQLDLPPQYREIWQKHRLLELSSKTSTAVTRAYSMANAPQDDRHVVLVVRIAVPPVQAPPGTPPGQASSYIFSLKPGDRVAVSGPFGEFHAQPTDNEMVLIAGGAGIAPIRSIALDQLARGTGRRMSLWYGVRDPAELCFHAEFRSLAEQFASFDYHAAVSDAKPDTGWKGYTGLIHSVVHEHYLNVHPAPEDIEYYLCGPPLMSAAVLDMLESLGVDDSNIWLDDFGT